MKLKATKKGKEIRLIHKSVDDKYLVEHSNENFAILTNLRTKEVITLRGEELDLKCTEIKYKKIKQVEIGIFDAEGAVIALGMKMNEIIDVLNDYTK